MPRFLTTLASPWMAGRAWAFISLPQFGVSTYINRAAAAIIKSYLDDNGQSITQIADEMQFTSVSYFSRYCVKHLGMSPARYRMAKC